MECIRNQKPWTFHNSFHLFTRDSFSHPSFTCAKTTNLRALFPYQGENNNKCSAHSIDFSCKARRQIENVGNNNAKWPFPQCALVFFPNQKHKYDTHKNDSKLNGSENAWNRVKKTHKIRVKIWILCMWNSCLQWLVWYNLLSIC